MYNLFSGLVFCPCFYMKRSHSVQCCLIWRRKASWLCWNTLSKSSKEEEDSHICILLATSLNNLIPIRSACVVGQGGGGGDEGGGEDIYRDFTPGWVFVFLCFLGIYHACFNLDLSLATIWSLLQRNIHFLWVTWASFIMELADCPSGFFPIIWNEVWRYLAPDIAVVKKVSRVVAAVNWAQEKLRDIFLGPDPSMLFHMSAWEVQHLKSKQH